MISKAPLLLTGEIREQQTKPGYFKSLIFEVVTAEHPNLTDTRAMINVFTHII